jgi:hypothetical protein
MEQGRSWENYSSSASYTIFSILWNWEVHYRDYRNPTLVSIMIQINFSTPAHQISLRSILILSSHLPPSFRFPHQIFSTYFSWLPYVLHVPPVSSSLLLRSRQSFIFSGISQHNMDLEGSLLCSQESSTGVCRQPDKSTPYRTVLFLQDPSEYYPAAYV